MSIKSTLRKWRKKIKKLRAQKCFWVLTIQAGIIILGTTYLCLSIICPLVNLSQLNPLHEVTNKFILWVILMIVCSICLFIAAYYESMRMCLLSALLVLITCCYWVYLSIYPLYFVRVDYVIEKYCFEYRCGETFWLMNLHYRLPHLRWYVYLNNSGNIAEKVVNLTTDDIMNSDFPDYSIFLNMSKEGVFSKPNEIGGFKNKSTNGTVYNWNNSHNHIRKINMSSKSDIILINSSHYKTLVQTERNVSRYKYKLIESSWLTDYSPAYYDPTPRVKTERFFPYYNRIGWDEFSQYAFIVCIIFYLTTLFIVMSYYAEIPPPTPAQIAAAKEAAERAKAEKASKKEKGDKNKGDNIVWREGKRPCPGQPPPPSS